jgi:hypothetical protein
VRPAGGDDKQDINWMALPCASSHGGLRKKMSEGGLFWACFGLVLGLFLFLASERKEARDLWPTVSSSSGNVTMTLLRAVKVSCACHGVCRLCGQDN